VTRTYGKDSYGSGTERSLEEILSTPTQDLHGRRIVVLAEREWEQVVAALRFPAVSITEDVSHVLAFNNGLAEAANAVMTTSQAWIRMADGATARARADILVTAIRSLRRRGKPA